jgi:glycylpeptide N-tetradecanoyltransferase
MLIAGQDSTNKITDFFSFYALESSIISNQQHRNIRAAYLFYYATDLALSDVSEVEIIKKHLQSLINDALILAKRYNFAVFNTLSLMDNSLFIKELKFRPGTGQLHYHLYNYRANVIAGGINERQEIGENQSSGVGFIPI